MRVAVGKMLVYSVNLLWDGESDELAATLKHPAEEVEGVECVGEVGKESNHHPILDDVLDTEHPWRSRREVVVAEHEEELGEVPCGPPP